MLSSAVTRLPISSPRALLRLWVKSPSAIFCAMAALCTTGRVIERVTVKATATMAAVPSSAIRMIILTKKASLPRASDFSTSAITAQFNPAALSGR
ncbi:MAG: hypothetical protein BWY87_01253 [Deltaproteobacteria bacterium ADurb.Bin510]|nr:MAG: hypothetical protein BWY87_01253 [Deltaproteobacteria bacterium ADurb.Bin510]